MAGVIACIVFTIVAISKIATWYSALRTRSWGWPITSSPTTADRPKAPVAQPVATLIREPLQPVAKTHNDCNDPLRVAETATVKALAIMITESRKKPFYEGRVPETKGLELLFGVKRSSEPGSEYQRLRRLLLEELECLKPVSVAPQFPQLTPEQELLRRNLELDAK